jgi:hypothetical protein
LTLRLLSFVCLPPLFFVSVDSKPLNFHVSPLGSAVARGLVSVASKGFTITRGPVNERVASLCELLWDSAIGRTGRPINKKAAARLPHSQNHPSKDYQNGWD